MGLEELRAQRDQILGIGSFAPQNFGATTEAEMAEERRKKASRIAAKDAEKIAAEEKKRAEELKKIAKAEEKFAMFTKIAKQQVNETNFQQISKALGLSEEESKKLAPAIKSALDKGADYTEVMERAGSAAKVLRQETAEIAKITAKPLEVKLSQATDLQRTIKDLTELNRGFEKGLSLGLTKEEAKKASALIQQAFREGKEDFEIQAGLEGLREQGFFDDTKKQLSSVSQAQGNVFEVGTAEASAFLQNNKVQFDQLDQLTQINKNTKNQNQVVIETKGN